MMMRWMVSLLLIPVVARSGAAQVFVEHRSRTGSVDVIGAVAIDNGQLGRQPLADADPGCWVHLTGPALDARFRWRGRGQAMRVEELAQISGLRIAATVQYGAVTIIDHGGVMIEQGTGVADVVFVISGNIDGINRALGSLVFDATDNRQGVLYLHIESVNADLYNRPPRIATEDVEIVAM